MNAPDDLFLPDVQSGEDRRNLDIQRVGVKSLTHPVLIASVRGPQPSVASIDMYVGLPADQKGTHMSRFVDVLQGHEEPLSMKSVRNLLRKMVERLDGLYQTLLAARAAADVVFAPVSPVNGRRVLPS